MSSQSVITSLCRGLKKNLQWCITALVCFLCVQKSAWSDETAFADVIYATSDRIYLNAGAADGIEVGDVLELERSDIKIARIEIINAGFHIAAARARTVGSLPRLGDRVVFTRPAAKKSPEPAAPDSVRPLSDKESAELWTRSLLDNPPKLVRYVKSDDPAASPSVNGRAETDYHLYSYIQRQDGTRHEQRLLFWMHGENLGVEGLEVRFRGKVLARYDDNPDLYLDGRRAIPLIREIAVSYHPKRHAFFGTVGRFAPRMPQASLVDGVEAGAALDKFSLSAFGGLLPQKKDLVPAIHQQTLGAVAAFHPMTGPWRLETEEGVLAEIRDSSFSRAAVTIDNRISANAEFYMSQIATFDFLGTNNQGDPVSDFSVSLLGLDSGCQLNDTMNLDLRARYDEQTVFVEDENDLSAAWIASLRGKRHGRVEAGLSASSDKVNTWRPFVLGRGDFENGIDKGYTGGGVQLEDPSLFQTRTRMLAVFDIAFGTGQIADLNLAFDTPLIVNRLRLQSGLYNAWQREQDSSVNTLRHLLFLILDGRVIGNLDIFANVSAAYDHALVRLTYPFGAWIQLQVGATYMW